MKNSNHTTIRENKEKDYLRLKEMLNSSYDMTVTSPVNPDIIFSDGERVINHKDVIYSDTDSVKIIHKEIENIWKVVYM